MKKFKDLIKDIIYDKNDLLIALMILALAGFVINDRIGVIMNYPEIAAAQGLDSVPASAEPSDESSLQPGNPADEPAAGSSGEPASGTDDTKKPGSSTDDTKKPGKDTETPGNESQKPPAKPDQTASDQVSIYIEYGATGSQIAQLLVDSGLLTSKEEFYDAVNAAGADTKLQAGSFKVPANATPAQIISIITK